MKINHFSNGESPFHGGASKTSTTKIGMKKKGWQTILQEIIDANNNMKVSGRGATSYRTRESRASTLFVIFNTLTKVLKFSLEDPTNLKVKHIQALVDYWVVNKYAATTVDQNLSTLRIFCKWTRKEGMVLSMSSYTDQLKRTYAAQHDKSFTGQGIDFWEVWQKGFCRINFQTTNQCAT